MKNWVESKLRGLDELEEVVDLCWEGYVQDGYKTKNGKRVPNCVKKK